MIGAGAHISDYPKESGKTMVDENLVLDPAETSETLRRHGARIGRLEAGQQDMMMKLVEISAEGRARGAHQDRRADRDLEQTRQAIVDLRREMREAIAETTAPLAESQRTLIRMNAEIAGGVKMIRNAGFALGGVVSALLGYQPFTAWLGRIIQGGGS
ncbi:conserved hypothetical protein [Gluconacetobacter diazotrophicus PA1 5]|uniref:Uncharacterized protein n=2 Tax=Gluconacetobacter diazotrophicus TaxID=33996 RepID=A9H7F3_GLUDA|nr:conserved hypothetical protein [Gluconacetobacter diazotrophicus PA1 5]TWB04788.1 hypothetical protein FBZ86_11910 [Gluconacetobacter diazotrophicus]CAP57632.1 hypothetical protein GDI3689 [Gluconacetobacter diazotrophicus PA1 5]